MRSFRNFAAVFLLFLLFASYEAHAARVVIIPGIMGSKLCDALGKVVWGDRSSYSASRINLLRLPADPEARDKSIKSCGLIEQVNIIPLLWETDVYAGLIAKIKTYGYRDEDVLLFDYDWRLSNFENATLLKNAIENRFPNERVNIVAHSMGGLIARIYIQNLGGAPRIGKLLFMGTPHAGSATIFMRLKDGFENWPSALSGGLEEIQRTILSFPSTFQLLPTYNECCGWSANADSVAASYFDVLTSSTWERFSWLPTDFKNGPRLEALKAHLAEATRLKELLRKPIFTDASDNARLHFVANGFLDTWSRVFFHPQTGAITGAQRFPGDGTVLLYSATNLVPSNVQISRKEHESVFGGEEAELVLKAALAGVQWHKGPSGFSQKIKTSDTGAEIRIDRVQFDVESRVVLAQQTVAVSVTLYGEDSLLNATLPTIEVKVVENGATMQSKTLTKTSSAVGQQHFSGAIAAPSSPGAFKLRLETTGLEPVETALGVFEP
jgi:pimeloyl-ACP methyl ester carboxylesterase